MNIIGRITDHVCSNILGIRLAPRTLQLPITSYCNSKCKTCNIWKIKDHVHIDYEELKKALSDSYLKKVASVGINGGEPSLNKDFVKIIALVAEMPSVKDIYVISNGMKTELLLNKMLDAKKVCEQRKVLLHLTVSLDGTNDINNKIRGVEGAFDQTWSTIIKVVKEKDKYCDYFDVGYTISKENSSDMVAVKTLLKTIGVIPNFHIAVPNKRIYTFENHDYSILTDKRAQYLAREFFYGEYITNKNIKTKLKNFINYYYLSNGKYKRTAMCNYLKRDLTIDERLNVYLCATASETVGNLKNMDISQMKKSGVLDKEAKTVKKNCKNCIHYAFSPSFSGMLFFTCETFAKVNLVVDLICAKMHI